MVSICLHYESLPTVTFVRAWSVDAQLTAHTWCLNFTLVNVRTGQPILREPKPCCTVTALHKTPNTNLIFRLLSHGKLSHHTHLYFIKKFIQNSQRLYITTYTIQLILRHLHWLNLVWHTECWMQGPHRSLWSLVAALRAAHVICLCTVHLAAASLVWAICTVGNAIAH